MWGTDFSPSRNYIALVRNAGYSSFAPSSGGGSGT